MFHQLFCIHSTVISICSDVDPCSNNGTCTDGLGNYTCDCQTGTLGYTCDISKQIRILPEVTDHVQIKLRTKTKPPSNVIDTLRQSLG